MTVRLGGSTSGYAEIDAPAVAGNNTLVLPTGNGSADQVLGGNGSGTLSWVDRGRMTLATAQNTTSGTSIDFTGIPSWVKRVTVMFNGVSLSGTSAILMQIGAGSVVTSGYASSSLYSLTSSVSTIGSTSGYVLGTDASAAALAGGAVQIVSLGSNIWVASGCVSLSSTEFSSCAGRVTLTGTLDRIRITTTNGTDTFDAGSVNLLLEG